MVTGSDRPDIPRVVIKTHPPGKLLQQARETLPVGGDAVDMDRAAILPELKGSVRFDSNLETQPGTQVLTSLKGRDGAPPGFFGHVSRWRKTREKPYMGGAAGVGGADLPGHFFNHRLVFDCVGKRKVIFETAERCADAVALTHFSELRDLRLRGLFGKPAGLSATDSKLKEFEAECTGYPEMLFHGHISKTPFSATDNHAAASSHQEVVKPGGRDFASRLPGVPTG